MTANKEGQDGELIEVRAGEALEVLAATVRRKIAGGGKIDATDLKPFGTFRWLMTPTLQTEAQEWVTMVVGDLPEKRVATASASSSSACPASGSKRVRTKSTDADEAAKFVKSLFD